jgi:hypothetical protein
MLFEYVLVLRSLDRRQLIVVAGIPADWRRTDAYAIFPSARAGR